MVALWLWSPLSPCFQSPLSFQLRQWPTQQNPLRWLLVILLVVARNLPTRALLKASEKYLGQPFIVTNVAGGSGIRGLSSIVKEKPDGYTLSIFTISAIITAITQKADFSVSKDFDAVIEFTGNPLGFAVKKMRHGTHGKTLLSMFKGKKAM